MHINRYYSCKCYPVCMYIVPHCFICFIKLPCVVALVCIVELPQKPIGEAVDYNWRVQFQLQGSPHIHSLYDW